MQYIYIFYCKLKIILNHTNSQIEKRDPITGEWVSSGTSMEPEDDIAGLEEGETYKFRVIAVTDQGHSTPLESRWITTRKLGEIRFLMCILYDN